MNTPNSGKSMNRPAPPGFYWKGTVLVFRGSRRLSVEDVDKTVQKLDEERDLQLGIRTARSK